MSQKQKKGKLIVISGPTGSGQDSVIEGLSDRGLKFAWVITTTTRKMRKGESEGHPYYFIKKEEFEKLIKEDKLLEWTKVYNNQYYGCTREEIENKLKKNDLVILKIDPVGATKIKKKLPEAFLIFIAVSSIEILKKRLIKRGQDSMETIEKRLKEVGEKIKLQKYFDEIVVNKEGKLSETVERVRKIIEKHSKK